MILACIFILFLFSTDLRFWLCEMELARSWGL